MDTKTKGDIAEQIVALGALKRGWGVLRPVGDRLPYDLVFDVQGVLVRIQVKGAWLDASSGNYVIDNRRTRTNRRIMKRALYKSTEFDFAIACLPEKDLCYVFPSEEFIGYGSQIHMVESSKRQRKPRSAAYRDAWEIINAWAVHRVSGAREPIKFGEAFADGNPELSPCTVKGKV